MEFIIDTAQLDAIKKCAEFYPIDGVTTNPTIISREHTDFKKLICGDPLHNRSRQDAPHPDDIGSRSGHR